MRQCFLLLFLSAFAPLIRAQDTAQLRPPFAIYVMPTQLLNISYASGFTVGTEFRLQRRLSATVEAGGFYSGGYMAKVNLKYYLPATMDGKRAEAYYFALEHAYKQQSYTVSDRLKDPPESDVDYSVYKFVNSVHFKFGRVISRCGSLYMDGYIGAGVRYRVVHNSLAGTAHTLYHWNEGFIDNFTNANANGFAPSISFGWKIGYRYK